MNVNVVIALEVMVVDPTFILQIELAPASRGNEWACNLSTACLAFEKDANSRSVATDLAIEVFLYLLSVLAITSFLRIMALISALFLA